MFYDGQGFRISVDMCHLNVSLFQCGSQIRTHQSQTYPEIYEKYEMVRKVTVSPLFV